MSVYTQVTERSTNLTFHGIGEPARPLDPGEASVWVSLETFFAVLDRVAERTDVGISFDDGNVSDIERGLPALHERGLRGTFFIVAGRIGTPHFLDEGNVRALVAAGMEIGCHGMRHRPWRELDGRALHEELVEAKAILENVAGHPVTRAACPFGSYDRRVLGTLRRAGYHHVYTSDRGMARRSSFVQARNTISADDGSDVLARIAALEAPAHRALGRRAKRIVKRWR
ncbi:MAG: polysaccharide deacetylase family protein [Solirubrobacteraceae bacterium]